MCGQIRCLGHAALAITYYCSAPVPYSNADISSAIQVISTADVCTVNKNIEIFDVSTVMSAVTLRVPDIFTVFIARMGNRVV